MTPLRVLAALLLMLSAAVAVAEPLYRFDNAAQQQRFTALTNGLRCLVCQGESIADSNAELAADMRAKVHELLVAGKSDDQIRGYMTARYGDFVLFSPPFKATTALLWAAPGVLGVAAVLTALIVARRRRNGPAVQRLSPQERRRLQASLAEYDRQHE